jgi:hypothetical protein
MQQFARAKKKVARVWRREKRKGKEEEGRNGGSSMGLPSEIDATQELADQDTVNQGQNLVRSTIFVWVKRCGNDRQP